MTTPLQKAAQAVIDRWISAGLKNTPHNGEYIAKLGRALDAEIAQSVEPNTPDKEKAEYGHDNSVPEGYRTPYYCGVCSEHCGDVGSPQEVPLKIHARCHSCEEAESVQPDFRELSPTLWGFFHQLIHGDFLADDPKDLSSALAARQEVFELCKTLNSEVVKVEPTELRDAISAVCEGWTLPDGARKILESALWSSPPQPQGEKT